MRTYDGGDGTVFVDDEQGLGSGGRGSVFPVLFDTARDAAGFARDLACKVCAEGYRSEGRRRKVEALADMRLRSHIPAAWPVSSVYDDGAWAGFTMYRVKGTSLDAVAADPATGLELRVDLAARACEIVEGMHELGIVVGDVNMANFMYSAEDDVLSLVDLDSVQVIDERAGTVYAVVESLEKSPEMLEAGLGKTALTSRSDDFLVAVMVFRMLFGAHPLDSFETDRLPAEVRADNALARRFPYDGGDGGLPVHAFGDELALLFCRSFEGSYDCAPRTEEYLAALRALQAAGFVRCARCGAKRPRAGKTCSMCGRSGKGGGMGGKLFRAAALLGVVVVAGQMIDPAQLIDGAGALVTQGADAAVEALAGVFASLEEAWNGLVAGAIDVVEEGLETLPDLLL